MTGQKIRLIDTEDRIICEATVSTVVWRPERNDRTNHVHARLPVGTTMPMWHGGTYTIDETPWSQTGLANIYFSLPSGLENIWGQGNDFDVDTVRIHPEDLALILSERREP